MGNRPHGVVSRTEHGSERTVTYLEFCNWSGAGSGQIGFIQKKNESRQINNTVYKVAEKRVKMCIRDRHSQ